MTASYCYVCAKCNHPASRHGLVKTAESVAGPYRCQHCDCEMMQNDATYTWSQQQFERWESRRKDAERAARKVAV